MIVQPRYKWGNFFNQLRLKLMFHFLDHPYINLGPCMPKFGKKKEGCLLGWTGKGIMVSSLEMGMGSYLQISLIDYWFLNMQLTGSSILTLGSDTKCPRPRPAFNHYIIQTFNPRESFVVASGWTSNHSSFLPECSRSYPGNTKGIWNPLPPHYQA